jgi:hypothetical protein
LRHRCNKLTVFDWLSNELTYWTSAFDCVEVRFKTEEKFYRNTENAEYGRQWLLSLLLDMILELLLNWEIGENQMKKKEQI